MIPAALLSITSFFIFTANYFNCVFFHGFTILFVQSLPLYTSCLLSMLLNDNIVDSEKPDRICSLTFILDRFSGLFLHQSFVLYILDLYK